MENPTVNPNWGPDAAELVAQFLKTPVGTLVLARLQLRRPPAISGPTTEAAGLRGAEICGYEKCLGEFLSMTRPDARPIETEHVESYPSLDDNSKWDPEKSPET